MLFPYCQDKHERLSPSHEPGRKDEATIDVDHYSRMHHALGPDAHAPTIALLHINVTRLARGEVLRPSPGLDNLAFNDRSQPPVGSLFLNAPLYYARSARLGLGSRDLLSSSS